MEEIAIQKENAPVIRKAKILCAEDFSLDSYCVIVDGIYYLLTQNKLERCDGVSLDVFPAKTSFKLRLESDEINLAKLKESADHVLTEEKQKMDETKKPSFGHKAKVSGLRVETVSVKVKAEGRTPHQLLEIYEHAINKNLKDSRFKLDANSHSLIDDKTKFKVEFYADGSTKSDLCSDLNDPALPQNLADIQIAVAKTLQTLFRETNGAYPKEITNFYLIQENLSQEEKQKVTKEISPKFKEILKKELLKPEFNDIRRFISIEGELIVDKKREADEAPKPVPPAKKQDVEHSTNVMLKTNEAQEKQSKPKRKVWFSEDAPEKRGIAEIDKQVSIIIEKERKEFISDLSDAGYKAKVAKKLQEIMSGTNKFVRFANEQKEANGFESKFDFHPTAALFGIDFDHTIVDGHTYRTISGSGEQAAEKQWELVKEMEPIGGARAWRDLFRTLHEDGHHIAIVSFNDYPHIVRRYLIEKIGLEESFVNDHVKMVSFLPDDESNKEGHLEKANQDLKLSPEEIVLVDDSKDNIAHANKVKHRAIHAQDNGEHIEATINLSKVMKNLKHAECLSAVEKALHTLTGKRIDPRAIDKPTYDELERKIQELIYQPSVNCAM